MMGFRSDIGLANNLNLAHMDETLGDCYGYFEEKWLL